MNTNDRMTLQATVEGDGPAKQSGIDPVTWSAWFSWVARFLIVSAVVIAPWMIGSVQSRAQFWLAIALLIALAFWWFETALNKRSIQAIPYLALFLILGILIGLFQIMPLPSGLADFFLGRQSELYSKFAETSVATAAGEATSTSARISLNTNGTWHHIRLMVIALAAMLLSCRYFRSPRDLTVFLGAIAINGVALSVFGLVQKLSTDGQSIYWSIPLELGGNPFGPFVNRNNAGGYLLICLACAIGLMYLLMSNRKNRGPLPIISKEMPFWRQISYHFLYFVSELTGPKLASLLAVVFLGLGVFATASRGAILALLVASTMTIFSFGVAKKPKNMGIILLPLVVCISLLTVALGFGNDIIQRFEAIDTTGEVSEWNGRVQTWSDTWPSVGEMGKLGAGLGTYETVSRLYRTNKEERVYRYAENQYFQSLIEAGWPGFVIYLGAWALGFYYAYFLLKIGQSPATVSTGLVGVFLLWAQAIASFLDFGFYIAANTIAMGAVVGVLAYFAHSMAYRLKQATLLRFHFENTLVQVLLVVVFAACTLVCMDLNRRSRIDGLRAPLYLFHDTLDHEKTTERIKTLTPLAVNSHSVRASNELGRLFVHRAMLELLEQRISELNLQRSDSELLSRVWSEVGLLRIHERSELLGRRSKLSRSTFLNHESLQLNLPIARTWFAASLKNSPLQPEVQVLLGQIVAILENIDAAAKYLNRGIELAPSNVNLLENVTRIFIQSQAYRQAAPHFKRLLEIEPRKFKELIQQLDRHMRLEGEEPDFELILDNMLPDDAKILFQFADTYAPAESLSQKFALERAESILQNNSQSDVDVRILLGKVMLALGDINGGIDQLITAINSDPNNTGLRSHLIDVLVDENRLEEALQQARELYRTNEKNRYFRQKYDSIKQMLDERRKIEQ